jgi:hypothetical protein
MPESDRLVTDVEAVELMLAADASDAAASRGTATAAAATALMMIFRIWDDPSC